MLQLTMVSAVGSLLRWHHNVITYNGVSCGILAQVASHCYNLQWCQLWILAQVASHINVITYNYNGVSCGILTQVASQCFNLQWCQLWDPCSGHASHNVTPYNGVSCGILAQVTHHIMFKLSMVSAVGSLLRWHHIMIQLTMVSAVGSLLRSGIT